MIGIDNDECSHWFFGRLRTRLNNIRLPIGETVTLTFERRVHPNYFVMRNKEEDDDDIVAQQQVKEEVNIDISPLPSPVKPSSAILSNSYDEEEDMITKFNLDNEVFQTKDGTIDDERDEDNYVTMEAHKNSSDHIPDADAEIADDDGGDGDDNDDDYDDNNSTEIPPPPPYPYDEGDDEDDGDEHPFIAAIMTQVDNALHQTRSKLDQAQHDAINYAQMCDSLRVENDTLKDTVKSLVSAFYSIHTSIIIGK